MRPQSGLHPSGRRYAALQDEDASIDIKSVISMQSKLSDGDQYPDEGRRDDPQRQGAPAALAALGPAHRRDRLRRQCDALARHPLEIFEHRNRRTLDTLRYSLNALNRISWNSIPSQDILEGLAADAAAADGNIEALQAANEFLHHQAGQLAKISQQLSLQTNVQAVYWAYEVDREAADRATTSEWIANGVGEVPPYDSAGAVRGVPSDWPWACFGCSRSAARGSR